MTFFSHVIETDILDHADNPDIARLVRLWTDLATANDGLPRLDQLNFQSLDFCRDDLMVLSPIGDDDFLYLQYGPAISQASGFDMTGRRVKDFSGALQGFFLRCYRQAMASGRPLYSQHRADHAKSVHVWERLIMPVAAASGRMLFVFNRPRQFRHQLLDAVLDASLDGVLAMRAIRDDAGGLTDLAIMAANRAALNLLDMTESDLTDRRLLETFPAIRDTGLWELYADVVERQVPRKVEIDYPRPRGVRPYLVSAVPMADGLAITFSDITDFREAHRAVEQQRAELLAANRSLGEQAEALARLAAEKEAARAALQVEVERRQGLEAELRRWAETDPLTGCANRRHFEARGRDEIARADRYGRRLSLVMLDIDRFKAINDTHGHAVGDRVIVTIAGVCAGVLREASDLLGRHGGEEFVILLPETGRDGALALAERLRGAVREARVPSAGGDIAVTVSIGVAEHGRGGSLHDLIRRADAALYAAKHAGRDRIADAPPAPSRLGGGSVATSGSLG